MVKLRDLLAETVDERKAVLKHYNMSEDEFNETVENLKDWAVKSGFPENDWLENRISAHLIMAKMSTEKAKAYLKDRYRLKALQPNFYKLLRPFSDGYNSCKAFTHTVVMPKLTPDLCRIHVINNRDTNGEVTNALYYSIFAFMETECRFMFKHFFLSSIIILDLNDFSLKTLLKYTPSLCQLLVTALNGMHLRLQNIHLVNGPGFIDKIVFILQTVLPTKIFSKVRTHSNYESLYKYIPKEYLPSDFQGTEPSLQTLHEQWCEVLESMEEDFNKMLEFENKQCLENESSSNDLIGMGCDGSFKKLTID